MSNTTKYSLRSRADGAKNPIQFAANTSATTTKRKITRAPNRLDIVAKSAKEGVKNVTTKTSQSNSISASSRGTEKPKQASNVRASGTPKANLSHSGPTNPTSPISLISPPSHSTQPPKLTNLSSPPKATTPPPLNYTLPPDFNQPLFIPMDEYLRVLASHGTSPTTPGVPLGASLASAKRTRELFLNSGPQPFPCVERELPLATLLLPAKNSIRETLKPTNCTPLGSKDKHTKFSIKPTPTTNKTKPTPKPTPNPTPKPTPKPHTTIQPSPLPLPPSHPTISTQPSPLPNTQTPSHPPISNFYDNHLHIQSSTSKRLSREDAVSATRILDDIIRSVPHSIITLLTNSTIAATYEKAGLDIPMEIAYTAAPNSIIYPYQAQAKAYGLDTLILTNPNISTSELPMVHHPNFPSHSYLMAQELLGYTSQEMAKQFLKCILQTPLRHSPLLTNVERVTAPKNQTYAAVASSTLPQASRPKTIRTQPPRRTEPSAELPCTRCLAVAACLTTTELKHQGLLTIKPRGVTLNNFAKQLPENMRGKFLALYKEITLGNPHHNPRFACPSAGDPEKRDAFYKSAPNTINPQQIKERGGFVRTAFLINSKCLRCGKDKTPSNAHMHSYCTPSTRNCPNQKTEECKMGTCSHNGPPLPSVWNASEYKLTTYHFYSKNPTFLPPNFH